MKAVTAAREAAEAVRALNHITLCRDGYRFPADVDDVIGELARVVEGLPQALRQAAGWLDTAHTAGTVGHDNGADVTATVHGVLGDLERAVRETHELARTLRSARENTSHLTGRRPAPNGAGR